MSKVTADTITDEQIRRLRLDAIWSQDRTLSRLCNDALEEGRFPREKTPRNEARAQVAAILNARAKEL